MNCAKCGRPIEDGQRCPYCEEDNVRVMSRAEKDNYDGITIEADDNPSYERERQQEGGTYQYGGQRIYVRNISLGQTSWLTRIVILLIGIGLCIFFLPIALAVISIAIVLWLLGRIIH